MNDFVNNNFKTAEDWVDSCIEEFNKIKSKLHNLEPLTYKDWTAIADLMDKDTNEGITACVTEEIE